MKAAAFVLGLLCAVQLGFGQQVWEKKPYTQWSEKDVKKVLESSPWAQQYTVSNVGIDVVGAPRGVSTTTIESRQTSPGVTSATVASRSPARNTTERGFENVPRLTYTVQFRSAKPIRQALVRRAQLDKKYEQLDAAKRTESDRRAQQFIDTSSEEIMVYVGFETNVPSYAMDVQRFFSSVPSGTVPPDTFLNIGGQKLNPTSYQAITGAVQLTFQRPGNVPLDGEISVEFMSPQIGDLPSKRVFVPFKLKDMRVGAGSEL